MRAAFVTELPAERFALRDDVAEPRPAPGEAVVAVEACGICGTDLEILAGRSYAPALPFTLGHEPVGRVVALGDGADAALLGARVTMTIFSGHGERCDVCRAQPDWPTPCRTGDERLCYAGAEVLGVLGRPGAFAERLAVPAAQLVPVPDALPSAQAAALVDAGATAANAVRQVPAGERRRVVVVGAGPLGFLAAQLLAREHADVVVVEPLAARRAQAAALGLTAHATLDELDERRPVGALVDCAAAGATFARGLELLAPHGTYVVAGYAPVQAHTAPLARKELTVRGVRSGRREDLELIVSAVLDGSVRTPPIRSWPLERIDDAFAALRAGEVEGKAVIDLQPTREPA